MQFYGAAAAWRTVLNETPPTHRPARLRRLSDEEIELWIAVAKGVSRRKGATLPSPRTPPPEQAGVAPAPAAKSSRAQTIDAQTPAAPGFAPLEKRLRRQLARGRSAIDQSIDLHGMNQAQAH